MNAKFGKKLRDDAAADGLLRDAGHGVTYYVRPRGDGDFSVAVWRGRASKPLFWYRVASEAAAQRYVERALDDAKEAARRKAEARVRSAELSASVTVGTVFVAQWGYEQTNVDFYEVVARSGSTVTLREIASERKGDWSGYTRPLPGRYTGEPFRKRLSGYGVRLASYCTAEPIEPGRSYYFSCYA